MVFFSYLCALKKIHNGKCPLQQTTYKAYRTLYLIADEPL